MSVRVARWLGRNWARVSYGRHVEPTWLDMTEIPVPVVGLPNELVGLRIAHLSDLHCGPHIPVAFLDQVIAATFAGRPDLVALTGDFVHKGYRSIDQVAELVGRLAAPLGVFAVLGNHDFSVRNALAWRRHRGLHLAVASALTAKGVTVLRNRTVTLERGGATMQLTGLDDLWSRECDPVAALAGFPSDVPRVILAHNPQTIHTIGDARCDLMLSGHTHGGQVDWPGLGRVTLGKHAKRLAAGMYPYGDGHLYVHRGVGYGFRFRFGVRPEVAFLTLVAA